MQQKNIGINLILKFICKIALFFLILGIDSSAHMC